MQCLKGKSPLKLKGYIVGQFSFQHGCCLLFQFTAQCDQNMKKKMDIQRYKIQIKKFTHEVFHSHLERVYKLQKWAVNLNIYKFNK